MSNPIAVKEVIADVDLEVAAATDHNTFFTAFLSFQCLTIIISNICNISATSIGSLTGSISRMWTNFHPRLRLVVWEDAQIMPPSTLTFIISSLIGFAEIKAQGQAGFPFQTHPQATMVSVTSLLFFGLASVAQYVISASGLDPTSVFAILVRLGRIVSLCLLVASLASLFYI